MTRNTGAKSIGFATWLCATTLVATLHMSNAAEAPKNFVLLDKPTPIATISFNDAGGHTRSLADFSGKVLLVNIWATWCVPCRKEMPALDRLQATLGGAGFEVIPVSIDRGGMETIGKFYNEIGVHNLAMYSDSSGQVLHQVRALGLPTTLLVSRAGQEIGRIVGPAEWDAPEIAEFLKPYIADHTVPINHADRGSPPSSSDVPDGSGPFMRGVHWVKALLTW
ncbi:MULTISPECIES: TlpA disulfide reductase family protein [unclassified Bradyrhizobium]|uniref:TlpA family protein disulfide reductase n=1 Tax=unclassified Bradyrhizobium TaxID=2631580 RepID=UPI00247AEBAA|nr:MULTISPECIES: TlpA disulfide reductase family protein [unclassified Bradyrhizobium]WGS21088.1 TlpA family protein disulfide reductase [Bradyrhizobium sp. ISRA463]WGS28005.1 TlpA family protein disulfide reductase [Bradyrhizobium sp. ISRA464]